MEGERDAGATPTCSIFSQAWVEGGAPTKTQKDRDLKKNLDDDDFKARQEKKEEALNLYADLNRKKRQIAGPYVEEAKGRPPAESFRAKKRRHNETR